MGISNQTLRLVPVETRAKAFGPPLSFHKHGEFELFGAVELMTFYHLVVRCRLAISLSPEPIHVLTGVDDGVVVTARAFDVFDYPLARVGNRGRDESC